MTATVGTVGNLTGKNSRYAVMKDEMRDAGSQHPSLPASRACQDLQWNTGRMLNSFTVGYYIGYMDMVDDGVPCS